VAALIGLLLLLLLLSLLHLSSGFHAPLLLPEPWRGLRREDLSA